MAVILVIEDDANIAELLSFMLNREGHEVVHLADGEAARLHIERALPPDLVLLDGLLPYVDGLELLGTIRTLASWSAVPVIMLSARSLERDIVAALDAGANDYVSKPFQPDELLARVRRVLRRSYF
jgi:DNA-binding response OmpR family regulator